MRINTGHLRSVVMAAIEVDIVRTQRHSAADSVGAVPHHLIKKHCFQCHFHLESLQLFSVLILLTDCDCVVLLVVLSPTYIFLMFLVLTAAESWNTCSSATVKARGC